MKDPSVAPPTVRPAPRVQIDDLTTIIDDSVVLHHLSLELPAGEVTVLMGPSGVGKTTLTKHLVGLLPPDDGTVWIGSTDIWSASARRWEDILKDVGAMLGGSFLITSSTFASLSVLDNLTYTLEALEVPFEQRHDRAMERIRELDLMAYVDHIPHEMPAHAVKRLALARAVVTDAPFVVLDEIEVGLDKQHSDAITDSVAKMRARTGCTLLITTHNLDLARSMADNLAIMVNGRIVAYGPPHEVLDGIESTDDFDKKFEFSDYTGPAALDDVATIAERKKAGRRSSKLPVDARLTVIALGLLVIIAVLFLLAKAHVF